MQKYLFIIFLAGGAAITIFLIRPRYEDFRNLQIKVEEKKADLRQKEEYFSVVEKAAEELKRHGEEVSKINASVSPRPSFPSFIYFLQKAASQNGLTLNKVGSFNIASEEKNQRLKELFLDLDVSGYYPSFKNFLLTLEKTAMLIEVENISFAPSEKDKNTPPVFSLRIKIHSY